VPKLQLPNKIYVTPPQDGIKALVFFSVKLSCQLRLVVQIKLEMKEQHSTLSYEKKCKRESTFGLFVSLLNVVRSVSTFRRSLNLHSCKLR
jgi:hypothetical protein